MVTELTCSAALMDVNLSIKQPWHTVYCHLRFSHSDLSANYATHYMLILTKIYAVKTGQPREATMQMLQYARVPTCKFMKSISLSL